MRQRGEHGSSRIGATSTDSSLPWKIAIGSAIAILSMVGVGYALMRASTEPVEWPEGSVPKIHERARAAGIQPWMSKDEMVRLWDAYNTKHGRPTTAR